MAGLLDYDPEAIRMQSLNYGLLGSMPALMAAGGAQTDPAARARLLMGAGQGFAQGQQGYAANARANSMAEIQLANAKREKEADDQWKQFVMGSGPAAAPPQAPNMMQAGAPAPGANPLLASGPSPMSAPTEARAIAPPPPGGFMSHLPPEMRASIASMDRKTAAPFVAQFMGKNLEQEQWLPEKRTIGGQEIEGQKDKRTGMWKPLDPSQVKVAVNPNITMPPQETAANKEIGEFYGKTFADLQKGAMSAQTKQATLNEISRLSEEVDTGKFKGGTTELKKAALAAGINLDALGIKDDTAPAQALSAISREMSLQLRNPSGGAGMPGAMSDADRNFLESMSGGLDMTNDGRKLLFEFQSRMNKRSNEVARMARDYRRKNDGKFDEGFLDELEAHSTKNSIFSKSDIERVEKARGTGGWSIRPMK